MYGYEDYFDEELANKAYANAEEALKDYIALCEMILEDFAGRKGLGTEDNLFSKGMAITEDEMREYFVNHPALRDTDSYFYILGGFVEQALSHIAGREKKTPAKVFLPIKHLKEDYGLTDAETVILALSYMNYGHRSYERVFGFLQDDMALIDPTVGLAISLCCRAFEENVPTENELMSKERGLFGSLFSDAEKNVNYPLRTKLILTAAALNFLNGKEMGTEYLRPVKKEEAEAPAFYEDKAKTLAELMKQKEVFPCMYLCGEDAPLISGIVQNACEKSKRTLFEISFAKIATSGEDCVREIAENADFYAKTGGAAVLVTGMTEELLIQSCAPELLAALLEKKDLYPVLLSGAEKLPEPLKTCEIAPEPVLRFEIPAPDTSMRTKMWKHYIKTYGLTLEKGFMVEELADCYEVGDTEIKTAVRQAKLNMLSSGTKKLDKAQAVDALKGIGTVNFKGLAKEIKTVYTWDDISMQEEQRRVLQTACNRYKVKNRIGESWGITKKNAYGNGVSVLLYGPPGTGKTMSAQVVAREIGLPLYRVDTSQLFSKYIGETQKNLGAVFDEAEKSNVILFFDEADALFSKRTDVESSNDRHANSEIAFLLQRIEEYKGMSLLATNYYSGFDQAFVRRITYAVRLEQPDEKERLALWKGILPDLTPTDGNLDYKFLAKTFELTGSNIKAILHSAAYMAGAADEALSMAHIVRAMKYEFDKLGIMPDSGKFGPYAALLFS